MKRFSGYSITLIVVCALSLLYLVVYGHVFPSNNLLSSHLTYFTGSNSNQYEKLWIQVAEYEKKSLPVSAEKIVRKILENAKDDKNTAQVIKSVLHIVKYKISREDDGFIVAIHFVESEINESFFPAMPLLKSILADIYWTYYRNNRYKILNRQPLQEKGFPEDLNLWDLTLLVKKCFQLHEEALKENEDLKNIQLNIYDDILIKVENSKLFRPTCFDFIAHRALDFYSNEEKDLIKPSYAFRISGDTPLSSIPTFINTNYLSEDSLSFDRKMLLIYQELLLLHSERKDTTALIDADLARLRFVYSKINNEKKDSLFEFRLMENIIFFKNNKHVTLVYYELAQHQANTLKDKIRSLQTCNTAIDLYPETSGALNCISLKNQIYSKSMELTVEKTVKPLSHFKALIKYRNLEKIYCKVVLLDDKNYDEIRNSKRFAEKIKLYLSLPVIKEWEQYLPPSSDFNDHSTEIPIDGVNKGFYALIVSANKQFSVDKNALAIGEFWSTRIGILEQDNEDIHKSFFILDALTGEPLQGARVETQYAWYNRSTQLMETTEGPHYISDLTGRIKLNAELFENEKEGIKLKIFYKDDHFFPEENFYINLPFDYGENPMQTFLFTDRKIYRPGQIVYFKGLILFGYPLPPNYKIVKDHETKISFYNVNGQLIDERSVKTNDFGTFSGSFTAPETGLTGQMRLSEKKETIYIHVEEYKRPKFKAEITPVKGRCKIGDTITVNGYAVTYSGVNVNNAKVVYRVKREIRSRYDMGYRYYPPSNSNQKEIISGHTSTNDSGKFNFKFIAENDFTAISEKDPVYEFEITANITDISGETRTASSTVYASTKSLIIDLPVEPFINKNKNWELKIISTNLNGDFLPAKGSLKIYKLKEPATPLRERLWNTPDQFLIGEKQFTEIFPGDVYNNENQQEQWNTEEMVVEEVVDTEGQKQKIISANTLNTWLTGKYKIILSCKDSYGSEISIEKYFSLYDENSKKPLPGHFYVIDDKQEYQPGDKIKILIGCGHENLNVLYQVIHRNEITSSSFFILNKEQKIIEVPVTEEHRGNFILQFAAVNNYRDYIKEIIIHVPWNNKKINTKLVTFKNKLLPGSENSWKLQLLDYNNKPLQAEGVITMYDASLDYFIPHSWSFDIFPQFNQSISLHPDLSFSTTRSSIPGIDWNPKYENHFQQYDQLNMFGLYLINMPYFQKQRSMAAVSGDATETTALENVLKSEIAALPQHETSLTTQKQSQKKDEQETRQNFNETSFFYPHLQSDKSGNMEFQFKMPDALTEWKLMGMFHAKDLQSNILEYKVITQKELMAELSTPRFFREGDRFVLTAKVSNVSKEKLDAKISIQLIDPNSNAINNESFNLKKSEIAVSIDPEVSSSASWEIIVPKNISCIHYKLIARTENHEDIEESSIPVLPSRILVTESLPMYINGNTAKNYSFEKFVNPISATLAHHQFAIEFTSNPSWQVVQALPFIMESTYDNSEQVFNRFYANLTGWNIFKNNPSIKEVFELWKKENPDALKSNLYKNEDLKSLILEETPWINNGMNETEQKLRIALFYDEKTLFTGISNAFQKLQEMQLQDGSWPWFSGMHGDRYMTQLIISGFGKLKAAGIYDPFDYNKNGMPANNLSLQHAQIQEILRNSVAYIDRKMLDEYEKIMNDGTDKNNCLSYYIMQYVYARSFFTNIAMPENYNTAFSFWINRAKEECMTQNKYGQALIALGLQRFSNAGFNTSNADFKNVPLTILNSLKEHALFNDEMGMYWKENVNGYYWNESAIETQALLIELFDLLDADKKNVEELKKWLLKHKQVNNWKTTRATADACYAFLLRGDYMLSPAIPVKINIGGKDLIYKNDKEEGTGYFKKIWNKNEIKPELGNITLKNENTNIAWGALHWQYFEEMGAITAHSSNALLIKKEVYKQIHTPEGLKLTSIDGRQTLQTGDRIIIRLILKTDRGLEYVHLKDMRGAGMEPENVISKYKYQGGIGYYESTRDAATHFFISYLNKGTYVFEYPLRITHQGTWENGIATIQCLYAPEFNAHSGGSVLSVK